MTKKKKVYNSRSWLQSAGESTAFVNAFFSDGEEWFDASLKLSDCSRIVTIHPIKSRGSKDKEAYIKKLRVITSEIDKLVAKIEESMK